MTRGSISFKENVAERSYRPPFAKLQALPKDGKAVTTWPDRDTAWKDVSGGIERVVEEIRARGTLPRVRRPRR